MGFNASEENLSICLFKSTSAATPTLAANLHSRSSTIAVLFSLFVLSFFSGFEFQQTFLRSFLFSPTFAWMKIFLSADSELGNEKTFVFETRTDYGKIMGFEIMILRFSVTVAD